jgi:5-methylcytosine-specific restriction endonuclease McrA
MENEILFKMRELRKQGYSYSKIANILGIPATTVRYHVNESYKSGAVRRSREYRVKEPLQPKINDFWRESPQDRDFSFNEAKTKIVEQSCCYLTGSKIDLEKTETYALDHIVPKSKGGKSNLANLGLLRKDVNAAKSDKTVDEFLALCKEILEYNGYKVCR